MVDGAEYNIAEQVLDSQLMRGQLQFLVKWEGYRYEENSWVPELDIAALDKIWEFYNAHPGAPWWADPFIGFPLPYLPHFKDAAC